MCSVKVHVFRCNCGVFLHTSYVHDQNSITYGTIVTPEMCRLASKSKKIEFTAFDENFDVSIEFDTTTQSNFNDGQVVSSTIECTSGQIKHYTFETLLQRVNLTYNYGPKEVSNWYRKKLPCLLMEDSCKTTTLNSFANTWDTSEICMMTKILTQDARLFYYPLTTDQKESQFLFLCEFNDTGKRMNKKFKVFPESYELCGKAERLYKTNFESLFVNYQGGFAMPGRELRTQEY